MPASPVLRTQANEVLALVQQSGMDPSGFRWEMGGSGHTSHLTVSVLQYVGTDFYFKFDFNNGKHYARFSPGLQTLVQENYPGEWATQLQYVARWLKYLKREATAPDLWSVVAEGGQFALGPSGAVGDNSLFTPLERTRVRESLREIREFMVSAQQLSAHQIGILGERLAYLEQASERIGRKDWIVLALGTLANIMVAAALAPDAARDLVRVAGTMLGWIINQPPTLP